MGLLLMLPNSLVMAHLTDGAYTIEGVFFEFPLWAESYNSIFGNEDASEGMKLRGTTAEY